MAGQSEIGDGQRDPERNELCERSFAFALRIVRLCDRLMERPGPGRVLAGQLLKSGTAIGANYEEAQAAESRADFVHKSSVVLKEARESHYWLRLIHAAGILPTNQLDPLVDEARQLKCIFGAIVSRTKRN